MTGIGRRMLRKAIRKNGGKPDSDRPQVTDVGETGYRTLHPTKGWRTVNYSRQLAQQIMAQKLDHFVPRRPKPAVTLTPPPVETKCVRLSRDATAQERRDAHKAKMARKYAPQPIAEEPVAKKPRRTKKAA